MNNFQNCDSYNNIPSSQTYRPWKRFELKKQPRRHTPPKHKRSILTDIHKLNNTSLKNCATFHYYTVYQHLPLQLHTYYTYEPTTVFFIFFKKIW
jgi:hypothetical protein